MDRKIIVNKLELAYSPLSSFEFAHVKEDPIIEQALEESSLYVIAQRPIITFENVYPDYYDYTLNFEIHQKGNKNILVCKLPFIQKSLRTTFNDTIAIAINCLDKENAKKEIPFGNLYGFSIIKQTNKVNKFLIWFSPEKLLQNWWKGYIQCDIKGDFKSFLNYNVHYVGKATKQSILKRLTGHSTFQDILSLEAPITYKDLPAHEIAILCFKFNDNLHLHVFGADDNDVKEMTSSIMGENFPTQEKIFLDAEKALIRAMEPKYNKELFKGYPKSKDGLYNDKFDYISYSFIDPITLKYKEGEIRGLMDYEGGDSIVIKDNKQISLVVME